MGGLLMGNAVDGEGGGWGRSAALVDGKFFRLLAFSLPGWRQARAKSERLKPLPL